jgi:hypothetical protein
MVCYRLANPDFRHIFLCQDIYYLSGYALMEMSAWGKKLISVNELKCLLIEIREKQLDICFRYRLLGEMWCDSFYRILHVTDHGAIFIDEIKGQVVFLNSLFNIMQFELDVRFQNFEPHYHYEVSPVVVY